MRHQIFYEKEALKELEKLDPSVSRRIIEKIDKMQEDPFSKDIKRLKGSNDFRLRVGDYRIIFSIDKELITILKVGHRKNIYDR